MNFLFVTLLLVIAANFVEPVAEPNKLWDEAKTIALTSQGKVETLYELAHKRRVLLEQTQKRQQPTDLPSSIILTAGSNLTWRVYFIDRLLRTGQGFDEPTIGPQAEQVLVLVLKYISSKLTYRDRILDILIDQSNPPDTLGELIALGGTYYSGSDVGFLKSAIHEHLDTGIDPLPNQEDGYIKYVFRGTKFIFDQTLFPNDTSQVDFFYTTLHEFTHILGFSSSLTANGGSLLQNGTIAQCTCPRTNYDKFLVAESQPLFDTDPTSPTYGKFIGSSSSLIGNNGGTAFGGPTAIQANNDVAPKVHTPVPFRVHNSLSHYDSSLISIMGPSPLNCIIYRGYTKLDLASLYDLGLEIDYSGPFYEPTAVGRCDNGSGKLCFFCIKLFFLLFGILLLGCSL